MTDTSFFSLRLADLSLAFAAACAFASAYPDFAPARTYAGADSKFAGPGGRLYGDLGSRRAVASTVDFGAEDSLNLDRRSRRFGFS